MEKTEEIQYILEMYETLASTANSEFVSDEVTEKNFQLQQTVSKQQQDIKELNKKISWLRNKRDEYRTSLDEHTKKTVEAALHVENANLRIENSDLKFRALELENKDLSGQLKRLNSEAQRVEEKLLKEKENVEAYLNKQLEKQRDEHTKNNNKLIEEQSNLRNTIDRLTRENFLLAQSMKKEDFRRHIIKKSPLSNLLHSLSTFFFKISKKAAYRSNWVKRLRKSHSSVEREYMKQYPDIEAQDWLTHILENGFIEGRLNKSGVSRDMYDLEQVLKHVQNEVGQKW